MPLIAVLLAVSFFITPAVQESVVDEEPPGSAQSVTEYQRLSAVSAPSALPTKQVEVELQPKASAVVGNGQCVDYVKYRLGYAEEEWESAKNFYEKHSEFNFVQLDEPIVGAVVVTDEGVVWHVAIVESVSEHTIHISEQNYNYREYGERELDKEAPQIMGYFIWSEEE